MYLDNLQHYTLKHKLAFTLLLMASLTACADNLNIRPINTPHRINTPVATIEAARIPDIVLKHYIADIPFPLKTIVVLSVGFAPGNYTTPDASGLQSLLTTLQLGPEIVDIRIEGHSYSQGLHASEKLALKRARIVKEALVAAGIERAIKTTGIFANNVAEAAPFTGVRAYLTYPHNSTKSISQGIPQSTQLLPQPRTTSATTNP